MALPSDNLISQYLAYTDSSECPKIYSRWAAIVGIGALLGRSTYISRGHFDIYPHIYAMLIGSSGTGKGTSIKLIARLLKQAGYTRFSPNKVKPETFLKLLGGESGKVQSVEDFLWKDMNNACSEMFVAADEFNNFIGVGNLDFISILGELWDCEGTFENPLATKADVVIQNPSISILGGNTQTNFHTAFPPETIGQGFFSRLLLIHATPLGKKDAFPLLVAPEVTANIVAELSRIRGQNYGAITPSVTAQKLLQKIYKQNPTIDDIRFDAYNNRRFTHLLKLCMILHAAQFRSTSVLDEETVIWANTILTVAELGMPKALGEFGRARNSDIAHKVLDYINSVHMLVTIQDIHKQVSQDIERMAQLVEVLQNLSQADKIQIIPGKGFLPKKKIHDYSTDDTLDLSLLTSHETEGLI